MDKIYKKETILIVGNERSIILNFDRWQRAKYQGKWERFEGSGTQPLNNSLYFEF